VKPRDRQSAVIGFVLIVASLMIYGVSRLLAG